MKRFGVISTAALFLFMGSVAFANSQQDQQPPKQDKTPAKPPQHDKAPPPKSQPQQQQPRQQPQQQPQQQQQQRQQQQQGQRSQQQKAQQDQQDQQKQQQQQGQRQQQQAQQNQQRQNQQQQGQRAQQQQQQVTHYSQQQQHSHAVEQQSSWQHNRASSWQSDHRDWQQRGGYNGYRIPNNSFSLYFGSNHSFRMYSYNVEFFGGYPRFQSNGYWFSIIDPWPEYWASNWYEDDDCYIEFYNGGYYLQNRRYPGTRLAISISL